MNSSPFLLELSTQAPSTPEKCHNDFPFPPASPSSCRKGCSPVLTLELPLAPRKGKRCTDHPLSCLNVTSPCLPRRNRTSPPQASSPTPPVRCTCEPLSPLLGRLYCQEPNPCGSSPSSPCLERFSLPGSPTLPQRIPCCNWINPPRPQHTCPPSPCFNQHTYLYYCSPVASPLPTHQPTGASPMTSPQLTHTPMIPTPLTQGSQGTCAIISPLLAHRPLRTGLTLSPPLVHQPVETRPIISTAIPQGVLETGPMISPLYNDASLFSASALTAGSFYHGPFKPPDPCELKPQLDLPLGKNCCGPPLSSQAGMSGSPISPQEGSFHYSHLNSEAHISGLGSPYCAISLPSESSGSPSSSHPVAPRKPCFESRFSWETGRGSYLLLTPPTAISGPPCPAELPLPQCPYPTLYYPSPLGNQFIAPPHRSYNDTPLPTPVPPQVKSSKSSELRRVPQRCRSLINTPLHSPPAQPKAPNTSTSPLPPSHSFGLSGPPVEPSITTPNSCPKELPPGNNLPLGIIKTPVPTSLSHCLPCNPVSPSSYAKSSPHGPPMVSPCNTHICSMGSTTSHPCPLSGTLNHSTGPLQCHNQPMVTPCGTYCAPRGPPLQHQSKPMVPPCSTHIYSFIPLRTPFDPRCLPVVPQARLCPNTIPCGLHTYTVASQGPLREAPQVPYSCPLPSSKSSSYSTNPSCSSTIIISECQSTDNQNQSQNKSLCCSRSRSHSKSPCHSRSRSHSRSPCHSRSQSRSTSPHLGRTLGQCENPPGRKQGRSKSPHNKKK
uniref:NOL1/NOP2/Sun domain family, member 4 n=1 Tax=Jaculus jaculus TaxID=51337 RepID=A0A8C5JXU8_JACJA